MRKLSNKVTISKVNHPRYRWRVTYPDGGNRKQKYFKTKTGEDGAELWAEDKQEKIDAQGAKHEEITDDERNAVIAYRAAMAKLPDHTKRTKLSDAVSFFLKHEEQRHKSITCQDVADHLLLRLQRAGRSQRHYSSMSQRLKRFNVNYGDWLACDVTTEVIDDFLTGLKVAPKTQLNYRLAINHLFNHAVKLKATPSNPVVDAIRQTIKPSETGILQPKQVALLLSCADDETLPGLAISFFAGVRRAEIERLDWSEVDLDEGYIEIKASKAKTAQRRLIPISENLREWLTPYAQHEGAIVKTPFLWRKGQEAARTAAKIKEWPNNAGRHSFASYHLAEHSDAGKLAIELGHPNPSLLYKHYRQLVTPKSAKVYWSIKPSTLENITHIKSA